MRVALLAAEPAEIVRTFLNAHTEQLRAQGIEVSLVLLDENTVKAESFFSHALRVGRRQAKAAGCSTAMGVVKIITYKVISKLSGSDEPGPLPKVPAAIRTLRVATLNSDVAIQALRESGADIICLMGTRILTRKTLEIVAKPMINIHTSDPRFMRGSPSVVWEVLARKPEITLSIHRVTVEVDAGEILLQAQHPLKYGGGLGRTCKATIRSALPKISEMFYQTLVAFKTDAVVARKFEPGPFRVTPSVVQTLHAELICRFR